MFYNIEQWIVLLCYRIIFKFKIPKVSVVVVELGPTINLNFRLRPPLENDIQWELRSVKI